jgi:chemotaxis protein histidine kinase CheA
VHLLQNQLTTSSATLQLYSTLTLLLSPILHQPLAPIPPIASYLSQHLLTALTSNEESAALQHQLADIILDLVWQLDTQIDSAILRRPASTNEEQQQQQPEAKEEDAMQVDEQQLEGSAKEAKSEQSEEDKKAAEAAKAKDEAARFLKLETAARERLAEFVKLLIVRPAFPWRR